MSGASAKKEPSFMTVLRWTMPGHLLLLAYYKLKDDYRMKELEGGHRSLFDEGKLQEAQ
jgi:hypothetical protein